MQSKYSIYGIVMEYFIISGDKDIGNIDVRTSPTRIILPANVRHFNWQENFYT